MPEVVIVAPDGTEHVFPDGFDPKRAAQIVRTRAPQPIPQKSVSGQLGDLGRSTVREVNPIPAVKAVNNSAAVVINDALQGNFSEATSRAWNDVKSVLSNIGQEQGALALKADQAFQRGDFITGGRHLAAYFLPIIGPRLDAAADAYQRGDWGEGTGITLGTGINIVAPKAIGDRAAFRATQQAMKPPVQATPAAEAARFAQSRGIPVSAADASENALVRNLQQTNERTSFGGSVLGNRARAQQANALTRVGGELSDQVSPNPIMPEQAGQGVIDAAKAKAAGFDAAADTAYSKLRAFEQQRPIAVDVAPVKKAMQPIYEALKREAEIAPASVMGAKARQLTALDRLMSAPDTVALSTADAVLSDLKGISRVDDAFRRTTAQGIAAETVKNLETQVRSAAQKAGPQVFNALMEGRAATVNKYKTIDVLDRLRTEPVQVFNQATWAKDAGVANLRDIAKVAPQELPKIGRAFLDDLIATATSEGGFGKTQSIQTKWSNLGPETKRLLFKDPQLIQELDQFFRFAKRAGENTNPSGSGFTGLLGAKAGALILQPAVTGAVEIAQTALAKAMWDPRVVRLFNRALRTPRTAAAAPALTAEIAEALRAMTVVERGSEGLALPAAAEETQPTPRSGATR